MGPRTLLCGTPSECCEELVVSNNKVAFVEVGLEDKEVIERMNTTTKIIRLPSPSSFWTLGRNRSRASLPKGR
jgi:hypothetical protein